MKLALAILAASLAVAAPASAATVEWTPPPPDNAPTPEESCSRYGQCPPAQLLVRGAPGERNDVSFDPSPPAGFVVVRDTGAELTTSSPCTKRPDGAVSCPSGAVATIEAGDGDDRVAGGSATVRGGDGDDVLTGSRLDGGAGADVLDGLESADTLTGGPGADTVRGNGGNDTIAEDPLPEADTLLDGGAGVDVISFAGRVAPVRVDLEPAAPSAGSAGEGNVVAGIERAIGGEVADELIGGPRITDYSQSTLSGGGGDDRIVLRAAGRADGGAGADVIVGSPERDVLNGDAGADGVTAGGGADSVFGGTGADRLFGDAGDDALDGEAGADVVAGGAGRDRLTTRDRSRDRANCGAGRDRLTADRRDRATACERITRR
jgi:Ca2+-binding RTX toxin-like protein